MICDNGVCAMQVLAPLYCGFEVGADVDTDANKFDMNAMRRAWDGHFGDILEASSLGCGKCSTPGGPGQRSNVNS